MSADTLFSYPGISSSHYACFSSKLQNLGAGKKFEYVSSPMCHPHFFFQNKAKGNQELERQSKFSKVTQLAVKSELVPRTHEFQLRHFSNALSMYSVLCSLFLPKPTV